MKIIKNFVTVWILSLLFLFILSCASTGPVKSKDGLYQYESNKSGGITITDYFGNITELVIPDSIDGKKVTEIGYNRSGGTRAFGILGAFENKNLTKVTIPEGVVQIWSYAFAGNPLSSITFNGLVSGSVDGYLGNIDLTPWYVANNRKPGTYTIKEDGWECEYNGHPIAAPVRIIMPDNLTIMSINGNNALYMNVGITNPVGINKRSCYIPEGTHSLVVRREYRGADWKVLESNFTIPEYNYLGFMIYELKIETLSDNRVRFEIGLLDLRE